MSEQSDLADTDQALVESIDLAYTLSRAMRGKPLIVALRALGGALQEITDGTMTLDEAIMIVAGEARAIDRFMKDRRAAAVKANVR
jgi:hypothetical protein